MGPANGIIPTWSGPGRGGSLRSLLHPQPTSRWGGSSSFKEDILVAMLRISRALDLRFLIVCAGAIGLSVCGTAAEPTAADKSAAPPRTLMRLPTWIESLGDRFARPGPQPALPAEPAREPAAAVPAASARLTGGWTDLAEPAAPQADAAAVPAATAPTSNLRPPAPVATAAEPPESADQASVAVEPEAAAAPNTLRPTTSVAPPVPVSPSEARLNASRFCSRRAWSSRSASS